MSSELLLAKSFLKCNTKRHWNHTEIINVYSFIPSDKFVTFDTSETTLTYLLTCFPESVQVPIGREGVDEEATTTTEDTIIATGKTVDTASDTSGVINKDKGDHKLLKHLLHKMNKFERVNSDMVKAMKESNRYLYQILRNQKALLHRNSTSILL